MFHLSNIMFCKVKHKIVRTDRHINVAYWCSLSSTPSELE